MELITLKDYENGGKVFRYQAVDTTAGDYPKVFACCDYFARLGATAVIMPHFAETVGNPDYHAIYASLEGTPYWGKCPDFNVNGLWYEHEGYDENKDWSSHRKKRANTFSKMMMRGLKQSDRLIVEDCGVGHFFAKRTIYNRVHFEHQNISEVYLRTPEGLELLYKCERADA